MKNDILKNNPYQIDYIQRQHIRKTVEFFEYRLSGDILDIGQRSPLTDELERHFDIKLDNTDGDLDFDFEISGKQYDIIIFSHTIEHLFNPLSALVKIRKVMTEKSELYIIYPQRPHWIWASSHFHEIDDYRFRLLCDKAGLKIKQKDKIKIWYQPDFKGIRPIFRWIASLFFNNVVYKLMLA